MPKTIVVLPLELELNALVEFFEEEGFASEKMSGRANAKFFPQLNLIISEGGHGKTQFALTTQYLVDTEGPIDYIIAAGAAGGLVPSVKTGDVVIATEAVEHDFKKRFGGDAPAPRHFCCSDLEESIRKCTTPSESFQIHVGPITGGDEDIIDADRAKDLQKQTDALCVAWEGPGGARVGEFNEIPFTEVRAITDAADGDASEHFLDNLSDSVKNVGRVILPWLKSIQS
jgi:adenosylhomocysteine nucleosidase